MEKMEKVAAETYGVIRAIKSAVILIAEDSKDKEIAARLNSLVEDIHSYSRKLKTENIIPNSGIDFGKEQLSELNRKVYNLTD